MPGVFDLIESLLSFLRTRKGVGREGKGLGLVVPNLSRAIRENLKGKMGERVVIRIDKTMELARLNEPEIFNAHK